MLRAFHFEVNTRAGTVLLKKSLITLEKPMLCNFQSVPFALVLFLEQKKTLKGRRTLFLSLTDKLICGVVFYILPYCAELQKLLLRYDLRERRL